MLKVIKQINYKQQLINNKQISNNNKQPKKWTIEIIYKQKSTNNR